MTCPSSKRPTSSSTAKARLERVNSYDASKPEYRNTWHPFQGFRTTHKAAKPYIRQGTVYKAKWRGQTVAVKVLNSNTANLDGFYKEAQIMAKVGNHPNIVRLMGVCLEENNTSIVSQFYGQGSCYKVFVKEKREVPWMNLLKVAKGAAAGILHLHAENYIHRDIASRNILISDSFEGVVTDFGMSRLQIRDGSQSITYLGPVKWMAPESIRDHIISKATDVYMFGSFLWELVVREIPYQSDDPLVAALRVISQGCSLDMPTDCDPGYRELMESCLNTNPEKRPTFVEIHRTLEQLYEQAEKSPSASYRPSARRSSSPTRTSLDLDDSCPVFDLSTVRLDSTPSPFATTSSKSSSNGTQSSMLSTTSSAGYMDTVTFNNMARTPPNQTYTMTVPPKPLPTVVAPTSRPQPQPPPPRGAVKTNKLSSPNTLGVTASQQDGYLAAIPKLSINTNGYIFTTAPLTSPSEAKTTDNSSMWTLSSSSSSTGTTKTSSQAGTNSSLRSSFQSGSPSSGSSSQTDSGPYTKNSGIASSAVEVPKPRKPSLLGDSSLTSSSQISTSAPSTTPSPLSNTRPAGKLPSPLPESSVKSVPKVTTVPAFGPAPHVARNPTGSPAFGTITLYSSRVVPGDFQGWKPQFSLEHSFRRPSRLASSGPAQLSNAGTQMSQMGSRMQQSQGLPSSSSPVNASYGDQRRSTSVSGPPRSSHSPHPPPLHSSGHAPTSSGHHQGGSHGGNMHAPSSHGMSHISGHGPSPPSYPMSNNMPQQQGYSPQQQQQQPMGGNIMAPSSHHHMLGQSGPIGFGHASSSHSIGGTPSHHKVASSGGIPSGHSHSAVTPPGYPPGSTPFQPNSGSYYVPNPPAPMPYHNQNHVHSHGPNLGHSQPQLSHSGSGHGISTSMYSSSSSVPASPTMAPHSAAFHMPQQHSTQSVSGHLGPSAHPQQGLSPLNPFQPNMYNSSLQVPHYLQTNPGPNITSMAYSPSAPSVYTGSSGQLSHSAMQSPNNLSASANLGTTSYSSQGTYYSHLQTTQPTNNPPMPSMTPSAGGPKYNKPLPSIPPQQSGMTNYSKPLPAVPSGSFHHGNGAQGKQSAPVHQHTYQYPY